MSGPVLVVGGTGALGRKVIASLREGGHTVRALVRPGSDASAIEGEGVEIARGDMLDKQSLIEAMQGVDAVITTAAGYTRRRPDSEAIDTVGNANLVDAAAEVGVRRFVLCSILTADQTPQVPHFWHKHLVEQRLRERGVPFVSLRPGAFLDQSVDFFGESVAKGRLVSPWGADVTLTWVYTPDLARALAMAVDLPAEADGQLIDIGWDRPISVRQLRDIVSAQTGRPIRLWSIPWALLGSLLVLLAPFSGTVKDLLAMVRWFRTGRYVADTQSQARWFGVPTAEDAIGRWLAASQSSRS